MFSTICEYLKDHIASLMTTSAVHRIYKVSTKLPLFPLIVYPLLPSSKTSQQERHVVFLWDFSKNEIRWL